MARKRLIALVLVWTLPSVLFLTIVGIVYSVYRIHQPARLDDAQRTAVMATLRAGLDGTTPVACTVHEPIAGAIVVSMWSEGKAVARVEASGTDLAAAADAAAVDLHKYTTSLSLEVRTAARMQVDVITGTAPLGGIAPYAIPGIAEMLAIDPGLDGIGTDIDGKRQVLLPYELVAAKTLATKRPSNQMADLAMGVDINKIAQLLGVRAGKRTAVDPDAMFRFRTDTFVEAPATQRPRAPYQLYRGNTAAPKISAQALRDAALNGGRYLVAHMSPSGRYIYEHDLSTGKQSDPERGAYSMPRHAGTTYFLAQLYRITHEEWLREPIERAFKHLADLLANGRCANTLPDGTEFDCVLDRNESQAQLGSTALTIVALAEYQLATNDTRYLALATKLANFILFMQRPDGSFMHIYDPRTKKPDPVQELFYYSGESALALARMYQVTKDKKYAVATGKALDWLVHWYDFFMGGYFYGEEHWTCIASEAIWPAVVNEEYLDFCNGYGKFLRAQQPEDGEMPDQNDFVGAYNLTSFVPPYNTPAGSRTEAMVSTYMLGRHLGKPDPDVRAQIILALQYTLGQQIRPDNDYNVVGPGIGGMPGTPIDRNVRIDFVQHVCSGMIRTSEWLEDGKP
ncbi:MAG TPA: hypothetical protein VGM39_13530 [Kofleriaceae bacterium]